MFWQVLHLMLALTYVLFSFMTFHASPEQLRNHIPLAFISLVIHQSLPESVLTLRPRQSAYAKVLFD